MNPPLRRLLTVTVIVAVVACGRETPTTPNCNRPARPPTVPPPQGDVPCPSAAALSRIDVPISFEGDVAGAVLACRAADGSWDLNAVQKNVYRSLLFMQDVQFDAPLPWTNLTLYDWFKRAVAGIRIRTDIQTHGCCQPPRVINLLGTGIEESTIPTGYLEMMVHEGRHADGLPHTCGTNDRTIAEMGGYGVQYSVLVWLGTHWPRATQVEKDFVLNRAALLRAGVFCEECE